MNDLLDRSLDPFRYQLAEVLRQLQDLAVESRDSALAARVSDLRESVHEPFLFVVVGEVKAGKSSFVNALLGAGREICKVAPDPCTDAIYQLVYGEKEEQIALSPTLRKVIVNEPILKEISIVDTPGTNTLLASHQEITEQFIPRSDLAVFVFEARNPYRQSAWEFFDFIHTEWRKKVIFVLQQADLADAHELEVNRRGLEETLHKKGVNQPRIFAVSAKKALNGDEEGSGFPDLRTYIRTEITGKNAVALKLTSLADGAGVVGNRLGAALDVLEKQLAADNQFRNEVRLTLAQQENRSKDQAGALVRRLVEDFDRIVTNYRYQLEQGLSFGAIARRTVMSAFSKEKNASAWLHGLLEDLGKEMNQHLDRRVTDEVETLSGRVQDMVRVIDLLIQQNQQQAPFRTDLFSEVADRRRAVMAELREGFAQFMKEGNQFLGPEANAQAAGAGINLAAGSGIAVIGAVLAAVTQGMVFDITGGILSTLGILFAGATVVIKRRKIMEGFAEETRKGRERLLSDVTFRLEGYIRQVSEKVDGQFAELDAHLHRESTHLQGLSQQLHAVTARLSTLKAELEGQ